MTVEYNYAIAGTMRFDGLKKSCTCSSTNEKQNRDQLHLELFAPVVGGLSYYFRIGFSTICKPLYARWTNGEKRDRDFIYIFHL